MVRRCVWLLSGLLCLALMWSAAYADGRMNPKDCRVSAQEGEGKPALTMLGIVSPAVVSGAISVSVTGAPPDVPVTYCLDGAAVWTTERAPHGLGALSAMGAPVFSVRELAKGEHPLYAVARLADGSILRSAVVSMTVVPDANRSFSKRLEAYPFVPSLQQPVGTILKHLDTPGAGLTVAEEEKRREVAAMYLNFGFDLASDYGDDLSKKLPRLKPVGWKSPERTAKEPLSMRFSPDAPFYHPIPADWPRVALPHGFFQTIQVNTNVEGDGIGYGEIVAGPDTPKGNVRSMWYSQEATRREIAFRIPVGWQKAIPWLEAGDRHVIFVDPQSNSFISLFKTSVDPVTGHPHALYASPPASFDSLGDAGGSTAARFSELPVLIQPGEASRDDEEIRHAIGGSIRRVWAARVYPATARDYGVLTSTNTCTGEGKTNTGLVPYGGVLQLDPDLDLTQLPLSRPAYRILRAMQVYGYYVMDFGCADLDIYTAISERELSRYGGLYGFPANGPGVEKEIAKVITTSTIYVVPPVTRRP